jgi:5-methylcytosine-specific restriction endonuclease McrA
MNLRALVLNSDMTPIEYPFTAIPVEDAVIRVVNGTCEVIESYDIEIKCVDPMKLIEYNLLCWPSVIIRTGKIAKRINGTPALNLRNLFIRDNGRCAYSGEYIAESEASIDHVIPVSKGGNNSWDNVVLASYEMNQKKSDFMPTGKWAPKNMPFTPTHWDLLKIIRKKPITIDHESWKPYLGAWEGEIRVKQHGS